MDLPVAVAAHRHVLVALLEQGLARELSGQVSLDYDEAGLRCTMLLPLSSLEPAE